MRSDGLDLVQTVIERFLEEYIDNEDSRPLEDWGDFDVLVLHDIAEKYLSEWDKGRLRGMRQGRTRAGKAGLPF